MIKAVSIDMKRAFVATGLALLVLLAVLLARPGGIGGTGIGGDGNGGLGGTGIGIGGTGIGTGADTGFIGRIDSFGSIWVNGTEIFYDDDIPVSFGGHTGTVSELKIGHVVQVVAAPNDQGVYRTNSLSVRYEIVGPVQGLSEKTAIVLAQAITLTDLTPSLKIGDNIAVSGFRRNDGVIVASRIDMVDAGNPVIIAPLERPFGEQVESLSISGYMRPSADGYSLYGYRIDTVPNDFVPDRLTTVTAKTDAGALTIVNMRQAPEPVTPVTPVPEAPETRPVPKPVPIKAPQVEPPQKRLIVPKPDHAPKPGPVPRNRPETTRPERSQAPPERQDMQDMETPERGQDMATQEDMMRGSQREDQRETQEATETQAEPQSGTEDAQDERSAEPVMPETNTDANPDMNPDRGDMSQDERPAAERGTRPDMQPPPERPQRTDRVQPPQRVDRPERPERPERVVRPDRPERPERPDRPR